MPQIASTPCTFLRGSWPAPKMRSETWTVPGISGYGLQLLGYGDSAFQVTAVLLSNDLGVDLWAAALYAMQGQIVGLVNDFGDATSRAFLQTVGPVEKRAALGPGGITRRGEIRIQGLIV